MSRPQVNRYLTKDKDLREKQLFLLRKRLDDLKELRGNPSIGQLDRARDCLIKPRSSRAVESNVEEDFNKLQQAYSSEEEYKKFMKKYWERRTNVPYKHVINDEKHYKHLLEESKCRGNLTKEELLVHKIDERDKDPVRLEAEYNKKKAEVKKQDEDFGLIYSAARRPEHKRNFDYNHIHRFKVESGKANDFKEHIERQKEIEKNKQCTVREVTKLIDGMDKGQLQKLGIEPTNVSTRMKVG